METELIETKGYEFTWRVFPNGYELADKSLYECRGRAQESLPDAPLTEYDPNNLFLLRRLLLRHGNLDATDFSSPWLVPKQGEYQPPKEYRPLHDEPVLHRKFASLKTENLNSEVLNFAARFGLLGRNLVMLHSVNTVLSVYGESLLRWRTEIDKMGVLLALWDWIEREEAGKLGQLVTWPEPLEHLMVVRFKWKSDRGRYQILQWKGENMEDGYGHVWIGFGNTGIERGEILRAARHFLCDMLNHHLHGIAPALIPELGYQEAFVPGKLIDALWLMFMLEVNGKVRTCWYCRSPFEPARKDNVYCSNKCKRMAYYYAKQRKGGTK